MPKTLDLEMNNKHTTIPVNLKENGRKNHKKGLTTAKNLKKRYIILAYI